MYLHYVSFGTYGFEATRGQLLFKAQTNEKTSLHQRIRTDIERRILANEWPPGFRIPIEQELMQEYRCSRMTVNKALSGLVAAGFLDRRKKAGTFVVYPSGHHASLVIPDIRKAVLESGFPYQYRMLGRSERDGTAEDRERMKLTASSPLLEVASLHYAGTNCFAYEIRQICLTASPEAAQIDFTRVPPSVWLLTHVPWSNAEHHIDAVALEEDVAGKMGLLPGAASLKLRRRTWAEKGTITYAEQYFAARSLTLHASFLLQARNG